MDQAWCSLRTVSVEDDLSDMGPSDGFLGWKP